MRTNLFCAAFSLALAVVLAAMSATDAQAYLDGGSGSMLLQLLLGGVAGLAIAGKLYWYKVLSLFGLKAKPANTPESDSNRS